MHTVDSLSTYHKTSPPLPTPCHDCPESQMLFLSEAANSHHDFHVRRASCTSMVAGQQALQPHSQNEALALLPEDGELSGFQSVSLESTSEDIEESSGQSEDETFTAQFSLTLLLPVLLSEGQNKRQTVCAAFQQAVAPLTVPSGSTPVNEFTTEGYISCAFPTLFPTGATDFVAAQFTVGNHFKHLMMYKDGQFARYPLFCYFTLNTEVLYKLDVPTFVSIHSAVSQTAQRDGWLRKRITFEPCPALCHQST